MRRKRNIIITIIVAVALLLLILSALDARLRVVPYTVSDARIITPVRLLLITDLHSCQYGENQQTLLDAIDSQNPDLILLGGDLFDIELPNDNTATVLSYIAERYPCCFVAGNHEYAREDTENLFRFLDKLQIPILHGDCETITVGSTKLNICGVSDPNAPIIDPDMPQIEEQLQAASEQKEAGAFTVLLAHRPDLISVYRNYGFDLILCGHAHGGQFRIPGILNGLFTPGEQWFPSYAGGAYQVENTTMIVSRGLARESSALPRIWNRPELVVIDLIGTE